MFGLTFEKFVLIGVVAALVIGPQRLPEYARRLGEFVRMLRAFADATRARVEAEAGASFDDEAWTSLDPRQYDPRRIVRDALSGEPPAPSTSARAEARPAEGGALAGEPGAPGAGDEPRFVVVGTSGHPRRVRVGADGAPLRPSDAPRAAHGNPQEGQPPPRPAPDAATDETADTDVLEPAAR